MPKPPLPTITRNGAWLLLGGLVIWAAISLNTAFGRRSGEVDIGPWYEVESTDGRGTYLLKGVAPGNPYLDSDTAKAMFEETGKLRGILEGYGASWCQHGWLNDARLHCTTWRLFDSEAGAIEFLRSNDVPESGIYLAHR